MWLNKKQTKDLILGLLKTFLMILGLNIFLTTSFTIINLESEKNNLESGIKFNFKKLKYDQNVQFDLDIY